MRQEVTAQVRALDDARAFVEHEDVTIWVVAGADARRWLHDLVTTDVATLERGQSRASLLLTPTGRIRAVFTVLCLGHRGFAIAQPDDQPRPVAELLAPYVLSSDVRIDASRSRLFALPGASSAPGWGGEWWRPSIDGPGVDLLVEEQERAGARRRLEESGLVAVGHEALEARRIELGVPRFPVDLDEESLPAEASTYEDAIDLTKGCFLGQEAVAKVRNLGHPTRVVLAARGEGPVEVGEEIRAADRLVGAVTSANGTSAIVRIRWDARDASLVTASGTALHLR